MGNATKVFASFLIGGAILAGCSNFYNTVAENRRAIAEKEPQTITVTETEIVTERISVPNYVMSEECILLVEESSEYLETAQELSSTEGELFGILNDAKHAAYAQDIAALSQVEADLRNLESNMLGPFQETGRFAYNYPLLKESCDNSY